MKNYIVFMCAILALFAAAKADTCNHNGHILKVGESYTVPGTCTLMTCDAPNRVSGDACGIIYALKHFKYVPEDYSKPFPQCCPYVE